VPNLAIFLKNFERFCKMTFSLYRTRDGAGDSGPMSLALSVIEDEDGNRKFERDPETGLIVNKGNRPIIGCVMQVGSIYARTYQAQDYWMTTPITEILEDTQDYVRFRTGNSEYEWRQF
jgi:hypothetical protein